MPVLVQVYWTLSIKELKLHTEQKQEKTAYIALLRSTENISTAQQLTHYILLVSSVQNSIVVFIRSSLQQTSESHDHRTQFPPKQSKDPVVSPCSRHKGLCIPQMQNVPGIYLKHTFIKRCYFS